mgnify:CR=1 FL=1
MPDKNEINKVIYQSWHRGCKETDIILGDFAKSEIYSFDDNKFQIYKELISEDDWNIYNWFTGRETTPKKYRNLIAEINSFSRGRRQG